MRKTATTVLSTLLVFLLAGEAAAQQDVTIREINAIPQSGIDALNAAGTDLAAGDIDGVCDGLIYAGTLCGQTVRFTAVVMTDPLNSGLASVSNGVVGRIHVYLRDIATDTQGPLGMGIQIVDGSNTLGLEGILKGDVIEVVGKVDPYYSTMQISPSSVTLVGSRDLSDSIFDPIVVTTSDVNKSIGPDGAIQVNWDNLPDLRGSMVRIEAATVLRRATDGDRVDWNFSSDGGVTSISMYDTSIRFRNDRDDYPSNFNRRTSVFEAPPPGSTINIQGILSYNGVASSDPFSLGIPPGTAIAINPFEDSDLEITEAPINATNIKRPATVPGAGPTEISVDIEVDPARTVVSATLSYTTSSNPTQTDVSPAFFSEATHTFELPQLVDGDFVTYWFSGSDSGGGTFKSDDFSFRVLYGGITKIEHIQRTADDKSGDGPFNGWTVDVDLTVTVQVDPATGMSFVQDDTAPWSGVFIRSNPLTGLNRGDVVHITRARIQESYGLTQIRDLTFEVVSTGGAPLDYVTLTTNVLKDPDIAESYEGMLVNVEDPIVTATNADDPGGPFGEFAISSDGNPDNALRVDDQSSLIEYGVEDTPTEDDPATVFSVWEQLDFVRGALYFSFSNFKLEPESLTRDVGAVINVNAESEELPVRFELEQNFPNPFNPTTSISYEIPTSGLVTLDVFDSLRRRVRSLVNSEQLAGSYRITFDAGSLASGVYLYRLTTGNEVASRTLILLK